jgi:Heterokaryon incompatibility protein (HET)
MLTLQIPPANLNLVTLSNEVCAKCEDALPRLCESYYDSSSWHADRNDLKGWLVGGSFEGHEHCNKPVWSWSPFELEVSTLNCKACCFLQDVLRTDVDLSSVVLQPDDKIVLLPQYIGSLHYRKNQYRRYYRLKLQIFHTQPGCSGLKGGPYSILFPLAKSISEWKEMEESQLFHCRLLKEKANMSLIRHWFYLCTTKHKTTNLDGHSCQPETDTLVRNIQFRLVDISERCVVDGTNVDAYAALSYVWGPARRLLLTEENHSRMMTSGGLSNHHKDIPQTFRDAMDVAASLNIRYIWIDALCIRQDDNQDLTSHMPSMEIIYGSAFLTIVSNTHSVDTGIPGISYSRQQMQVVYHAANMSLINAKPTFVSSHRDSPWESRGWTLQEKIFSKRLLNFTEHQVFYHCSSATWFEDTILETPNRSVAERGYPRPNSRKDRMALVYGPTVPLSPHNFFHLVEVFAQRNLSFDKDALYAFNGLLKSVRPRFGEDIWGLPLNLFECGLTWKYSKHIVRRRRKNFPSWSWAGWRGCSEVGLCFVDTVVHDLDPQFYFHQQDLDGNFCITPIPNKGDLLWRRLRGDASDPLSAYCLPDHPGGSAHVEHVMEPFIPKNDRSLAPAHLLRFWTSTSFLTIDSMLTKSERHDLYHYEVRDPLSNLSVTEIDLDPTWRSQHPEHYIGEFIVISVGCFVCSKFDDGAPRPALLSVMLIERAEAVEDIAFRVQLCSGYVSLDSWRSTGPRWKLVNLA